MPTTPSNFSGLVSSFLDIIALIIPVIFSGLLIYLTWKMFDSWVINADNEQSREAGRKYAGTAILVFVLMVLSWGIVRLLQNSFFGTT